MSCTNSDDEFCETNFCEPSPVKRLNVLPSAKERNEQETRKEEMRKRIINTEKECFNVIGNSLKCKEEESELCKAPKDASEVLLFSPEGRKFFDYQQLPEDGLQPFHWLDSTSLFYDMTLEDFILNITQDKSLLNEERNKTQLIRYILNIIMHKKEPVIQHLMGDLLSKHVIPYDIVVFKEWGGPSLPVLVHLISKSVSGYTADQARELFRQACLSALDPKTFSLTTKIRNLISECLKVFAEQYQVSNEIDWIISLNLKPEEIFLIIEVLPVSGPHCDLRLHFAWKILPATLGIECNNHVNESISWKNLVKFLEENESKVRNLAPDSHFCFMYIIKFIVTRMIEDDDHSVEIILKLIDGLKLHFSQKKGNMSHYLSMEAMNSLYLICNEKLNQKNNGSLSLPSNINNV